MRLLSGSRLSVIFVERSESCERSAIVPYDCRAKQIGNGHLPGVIFTHSFGRAPLQARHPTGVDAMDPLP